MPSLLTRFAKNNSASNAFEYGLIGMLASFAIVSALMLALFSTPDTGRDPMPEVTRTATR